MNFPKLIYGTAWKKEHTKNLVLLALENGFRAIDTACQPRHYNEKGVGEALIEFYKKGYKREDIFLETKFTPKEGQDPNTIPYNPENSIEEQIMQSFEVSLKNLQTTYLDSYIIHSPFESFIDTLKAWRILESLHDEGKVKNIGISNCYNIRVFKNLFKEARIKPTILQNRFYAETSYDKDLRAFCLENSIHYLGFWTLTANGHLLASDITNEIREKYNLTQPQVLYRYLTQVGVIPLIGTTSQNHMIQDFKIFDVEFREEEILAISSLLS